MENNKNQAETLMSKFSDVRILDGTNYEFHCYYIEHKEKQYPTLSINKFDFPDRNLNKITWRDIYFTAEVRIHLNPRGGYAVYTHQFQLDIDHLKIILQKICPDSYILLSEYQSICAIFENHYDKLSQYLVDYNDFDDNYEAIANFICKYKNEIVAKKFGV
jgi:hypothetical protein